MDRRWGEDMKLHLTNGQYLKDGNLTAIELIIENDIITEIGHDLVGDQTLDLKGHFIAPGLVDIHVHLREPGFTDKETIKTGSMAAARGGFTTIAAMPNTNPIPDTVEKYQGIQDIITKDAVIEVLQYAPITHGLRSDELVDMEGINAFAYTNDGVGVQTAGVMYLAMAEAARLGKPIVAHTEDESLLYEGVMHQGKRSAELGLPGIMGIVESSQVARDVLLAKETGVHYHVCHVSSKETVEAIRWGKQMGVHVTGEVAPHHLILNEEDIPSNDSTYKMNPPLRSKEDQQALLAGLLDGTLDFIATDHAPHTEEDKKSGFIGTPFGIVGIETSFALMYTHFVKPGILSLDFLIDRMCTKPSSVFNLQVNAIKVGNKANLAVFNLEDTVTIDPSEYLSKSSNTPFNGTQVNGMCVLTLHNGKEVYNNL